MIERSDVGSIAVVKLDHGKVNALDAVLLEALAAALDDIDVAGADALVLTGSGPAFSAGVDLFQILERGNDYIDNFLDILTRVLLQLFAFPRPVVTAANGHAIAGGFLLFTAGDYRMMAEGKAKVGVTELVVGLPFPIIGLEIIRATVASRIYREMVYGGLTYPAGDALRHGLVDELVPPDTLNEKAVDMARRLATIPLESFRITKMQLRAPFLQRHEELRGVLDPRIRAAWQNPAIHDKIRTYLQRVLGK